MKNLKIQTKILMLAITASLLLILGGFYAFESFSQNYQNQINQSLSSSSTELGVKIATQFYERYGDVQAFALNPDVRSLNKKRLEEDLNDYVKLYGLYDLILVVDNNGNLVASNTKGVDQKTLDNSKLFSYDFKQEAWFKSIESNKLTEDPAKGFTGSYFESNQNSSIWKALGKQIEAATFSAPIYDNNGKRIGIITNILNNKWVDNEIVNVLSSTLKKGLGNPDALIIDDSNKIIAHFKLTNGKMESVSDFGKEFNGLFENFPKKATEEILEANTEGENHLVSVKLISDPKWIDSIGWRAVIFNEKKEVLSAITKAKVQYYGISAGVLLLVLVVSFLVSKYIGKQILDISQKLVSNANNVNDASTASAEQSIQLSGSATEQASALQETMSAIDEINAMVGKNAQSAEESKKASEESQNAVAMGKENVSHMLSSIESLGQNSAQVQAQVEENNSKLEEIMTLISSIESKTKVINDIVFQTKLLSFNASVEAARAGEHGKGFAVVADEVRKLAEMSGNSSKDISSSLSSTISQVSSIIRDSKNKMEALIEESKEKVNQTINSANECQSSFDSIDQSFSYVNQLVSEIATASKEQATGIEEISKAVRQIEQGTQQISSVAEASSVSAEQLKKQSDELNVLLAELNSMVNGEQVQQSNVVSLEVKRKEKQVPKPLIVSKKEDSTPKATNSGFKGG